MNYSIKITSLSLLLSVIFWAQAETIDYEGSGSGYPLVNDPWGRPNSLLPISGDPSENIINVNISSGGISPDRTYGGVSINNDITNNQVNFNGGNLTSVIYGGFSESGNAIGNQVTINGGVVAGVTGGESDSNIATGNLVTINGGSINTFIYGGYGGSEATENKIIISGGTIAGDVFAGVSINSNATNNHLIISGMPTFSSTTNLWGGAFSHPLYDRFTGNTLTFSAAPITVNEVVNFEYYKFTIDPVYANTATALITADIIVFGSATDSSKISVVGIKNGSALKISDKFILMKSDNIFGAAIGQSTKGIAQQGISLIYDVDVEVLSDKVIATITNSEDTDSGNGSGGNGSGGNDTAAKVNPQLKSLSEGYLSGLMLVTRGADFIIGEALSALQSKAQIQNTYGLHSFIAASGGYNRYSSGSHITSKDFLLTTGIGMQQSGLIIGAFLENGLGDYSSYNSFSNVANVRGSGKIHYYGLGLLGRYDFSNSSYTEASIRWGKVRTKFHTRDIQNLTTGEQARYSLKSNYLSLHLGAGHQFALTETNTLDLSAKYLWSQVGGKNVIVAGDKLRFDSVDSSRVQINADLYHRRNEQLSFMAGLGYEYEFNGKAKATALDHYAIDTPSTEGSTGLLSIGMRITPSTNHNLTLDFKASGYVGKRQGGNVNLKATYNF